MSVLDPEKLARAVMPVATGWLLGECMEARGRQELWNARKPEVLAALREQAVIQSIESSNRIEGVTVAADRLRPVALGKDRPRDRSEEELAGYRRALDWIFSRKGPVEITPALLQRLHRLAQAGGADAGQWKKRDNEIIEFTPRGERIIRFIPTPARAVPRAIAALCANYNRAGADPRLPPLLIVASFILDFLCIHPFRDGNGRVSRLATTLLLQQHGFTVVRLVSLERLIEERKEEYYSSLRACSTDWHEGSAEPVEWWNFFLSVLRQGYRDLETRIKETDRPAKSDLVRQAVLDELGPFTLADLTALLPSISPQMIKKVLADMKDEGLVRLVGRGRGARWEQVKN